MKKLLEIASFAGLAIVIFCIGYMAHSSKMTLGSSTGYDSLSLTPSSATGDTFGLQVNGTTTIDMNGAYVGPVSSTVANFTTLTATSFALGGGIAKTLSTCATSSWNPSAVSSTTAATIDISATGYVQGDATLASLSTSTQGLGILAISTSSATGTVTAVLFDPDNTGTAIDIATTTVQVCYSH